ncbi:citrate lyase subunit alpha [Endozoicomonas euniceicola]|uniref:Citrate lyase alpha chain n=1 Tax=Endozoicomonas euniceicola TaxID=1234143 RepID=A0ABY6GPD4_9GAMM|nr:citrate lyase subunit alpha [Endozoicomonas euniceicola]UYM14402.1 citrate lyase subunit alpha [Endozoicomonas euniceicola]
MNKNSIGREIPVSGVELFGGPFQKTPYLPRESGIPSHNRNGKIVDSLEQAIINSGLKDGMTISFHHHFRGGDKVLNKVMAIIADMGIKDLTIAPSSLLDHHSPVIEHIKNGVISKIYTSGMRGEIGQFISEGGMEEPVIIHSHGGRARMIESGELTIDVAFLGASTSDIFGNANGQSGKTRCGSLGYAKVDSAHATHTILLTEQITGFPNIPNSIPQDHVNSIVVLDEIGDSSKISQGAVRMTKNPQELLIARQTAQVIEHSGFFKDGFSFQTGSGGSSLAVARFLKDIMDRHNVKGGVALGGITTPLVQLHEEGYFPKLMDTQSFDGGAVESIARNPDHLEISASQYASLHTGSCSVNMLDFVVLSALEVDTDFNVNVMTGSDGVLRGASGGHCDTAAGANVTILVMPLVRGRIPCVVDAVNTVVTPGSTVDVLVTDQGIAVNPARKELQERLLAAGLPVVSIEYLHERAISITGKPQPIDYNDRVVALVQYRDGTIIDVVRQVAS